MKISTVDLRGNISDTINQVRYTNESVIVLRRGQPQAVLISLDDFELLEEAKNTILVAKDLLINTNQAVNCS